ncbi:CLUMA_CG010681, isoform A [Clunio marinus]|uniref:Protein HGH1 homolog n=1 Tax=Clunio marinus TaxID=568069 RepID=A0A1J1IE59_9DIPT|nr:CLUMA_CG010681, isoform A [Clunio marinus]
MEKQLEEFIPFLENESRLELKSVALSHILSLTGNHDGVEVLISNEKLLRTLVKLIKDPNYVVSKDACFTLINISADSESVCDALLKSSSTNYDESGLVQILLRNILDPESKVTDPVLSIFSNITRSEMLATKITQHILEIDENILDRLVAAFTKINYNRHKQTLNYLAAIFSNLSQASMFRNLIAKSESRLLQRLLPFTNHETSLIRRGGIVGLVKNICFDSSLHEWLFSGDVDVLPFILLPLSGPEEFDDETNEKFPIELQYLDSEKKREVDPDIRTMLLESLAQLCATKNGRNYLREKGTYEILRELHKFECSAEGDKRCLRTCEDVVDILIKTEDEIGHDNLKQVEIPQDMIEKIEKLIE